MILSILVVSSSISTMPKWIGYGSAQRHENHMYQHFYLLLFEGFIILTYWHPLLLLEKLLDDPNHLQKIIYFHVTAICKTLDVFFFFYVCAFVYYKQPLLGKYDELWSIRRDLPLLSVRRVLLQLLMADLYIPEAQKKLVVTMSLRGMEVKDIELAKGIHCRSIQRFINQLVKLWSAH